MRYLIILWYMITPPLGDAETTLPYDNMPGVHGAAVEQLDFQKTIVILGFYDTEAACDAAISDVVFTHLSNIDKLRTVTDIEFTCMPDPKP